MKEKGKKFFVYWHSWLLLCSYSIFVIVILGHIVANATTMQKWKAAGPLTADADEVEGEAIIEGAEALILSATVCNAQVLRP